MGYNGSMETENKTAGVQVYVPLTREERDSLRALKRSGRIIGVFVADAIREKLAREAAREAAHA
jgi:hypothetical protein